MMPRFIWLYRVLKQRQRRKIRVACLFVGRRKRGRDGPILQNEGDYDNQRRCYSRETKNASLGDSESPMQPKDVEEGEQRRGRLS
jgi:hypothetical protein